MGWLEGGGVSSDCVLYNKNNNGFLRVLCENVEDIGSIQPLVFLQPDVNNRYVAISSYKYGRQIMTLR